MDQLSGSDQTKIGDRIEIDGGLSRMAGLSHSVALTPAVWDDCVAWEPEDNDRKGTTQDADGRLWDLLHATAIQIRRYGVSEVGSKTLVELWRVERSGPSKRTKPVDLYACLVVSETTTPKLVIKLRREA